MNIRKSINRIIVPKIKSHIFMDPETFQPRRGIMTRYGRKLLEDGAKYYQKINVQSPAEYYKAINVKNIETEYKVSMGTKNE